MVVLLKFLVMPALVIVTLTKIAYRISNVLHEETERPPKYQDVQLADRVISPVRIIVMTLDRKAPL